MSQLARVLLVVLGLVYPAAATAGLHHETTEVHVVCADHGHRVHGTEPASGHEADDPGTRANAADSDHASCAFDHLNPLALGVDLKPPAVQPISAGDGDASEPQSARLVATATVLSYAPKQSPPRT